MATDLYQENAKSSPTTPHQFTLGLGRPMTRREELAGRVSNDFKYHPATPTTGPQHDSVRAACLGLANTLLAIVPEGREQRLMLMNLEQTMFWANAAIARTSSEQGL